MASGTVVVYMHALQHDRVLYSSFWADLRYMHTDRQRNRHLEPVKYPLLLLTFPTPWQNSQLFSSGAFIYSVCKTNVDTPVTDWIDNLIGCNSSHASA